MIKGIYTAASSMVTNQRKMKLVANNLANVNTAGYKRDEGIQVSFPEVFISRLEKGQATPLGELGTGVKIEEDYTDFREGQMNHTGNPLDVAIDGNGFFVVETPRGRRYTRNGNFTVNEQGQIVTQQGYPVLGERGPLQTIRGRNISINTDGQLYLDNLEGDRLLIVDFENRQGLRKIGENLYVNEGIREIQASDYQIKQGYLETSNVNIVKEMVRMIEVNRAFEVNQKVIKNADQTLSKAVNNVGKLG
ncbi:flagellar basal-body rod protein FlgF [Halothermothrix orenii]|uniref:Flagellar basal body rod protein n=1 Tax=Halothermothrix orenii (strain H 168 / OCM 544 / DSM 9562) TaxID=373903 RepID=B8CYN9_HALOH|nr:flagellar basal-body rod protein FlgF [Halothermothrix orenii]ACL70408.1 flagellar basal body rod protein [Halothermothrix orenii H 168]